MLELNRNPENYFADVEQAAFNPAKRVPGLGYSPDAPSDKQVLIENTVRNSTGVTKNVQLRHCYLVDALT
jgi:hypothetical protein